METIDSREVYSNAWLTVREDSIRREDGSTGIYGVVSRLDYVIVIPRDGDRFHLVEQFRYPLGQRSWEFPGGSLPRGETADPIDIADRELREETGLRATTMTYLGKLAPAAGTCTHQGRYFLATNLTPGPHAREPEEADMRSAWFTRPELESMISSGTIIDSGTVAAYTLLLFHERAQS